MLMQASFIGLCSKVDNSSKPLVVIHPDGSQEFVDWDYLNPSSEEIKAANAYFTDYKPNNLYKGEVG
jgi:hypothetical protein